MTIRSCQTSFNHCVEIIYQTYIRYHHEIHAITSWHGINTTAPGCLWRDRHGTIDETYRRVQAIVKWDNDEFAFLEDPVLDLPGPNTFVSSMIYSEAGDASSAYSLRAKVWGRATSIEPRRPVSSCVFRSRILITQATCTRQQLYIMATRSNFQN